MRRLAVIIAALYAIAGVASANLRESSAVAELLEPRSGGEATSSFKSRSAFTQPPAGLTAEELATIAQGRRVFHTSWVEAGASVAHFDGLGPFYSSRSCSGCHVRDGRGRPPDGPEEVTRPVVTKLSASDPNYGGRLSERSVRGLAAEGRLAVRWDQVEHFYPDGTRVPLRRPRFEVVEAQYGPLASDTRLSFRVAPALMGAGLLDAVPDSLLAALADPEDKDSDGISGRLHRLGAANAATGSSPRAGRFGWKATQPSLESQVIAALAEDMGITSSSRRGPDITSAQHAARARANGGEPEISDELLQALLAYCRQVAVPARRGLDDPRVQRGAERFRDLGCASCHVATLKTGEGREPAMARQAIHPFSDLLLHDMGPALSDGLPEADARAEEWRTPPLWGLGLLATVNGHRFLLHDGRARSSEEAILWHGGEAQRSRDAFRSLPIAERRDVLRFLESL